ncbi:MAG: hypothetical protein Q7R88_01680 [bacterium]|nr:hypothetical protein [bacterium]
MKLTTSNLKLSTTQGQALSIAAIFFLIISLTVALGVVTPVLNHLETTRSLEFGRESLFAAESAREDVIYRLIKGMPVSATESVTLGDTTASAVTTDVSGGKEVTASGDASGFIRRSKTSLLSGDGAAFFYGVQAGNGGIVLENSSKVRGNAFANGPVEGVGNFIYGNVISAGAAGRIVDVHATGSAYAHTIEDADVDKDAYYQTISGSTVQGALYPGSADLATSSLPVTDAQIAEWEADAGAGGTHTSPCPYKITSDVTLGPKKINCDLEISGNPTVTLGGPLHVAGNIVVKNSAVLQVSANYPGKGIVIIADNTANRISSSKISFENTAQVQGAGTGSYIMLISQNESEEQGGNEVALDLKNSSDGGALMVYAAHGKILLQNSIRLKGVTAYTIHLKNTAEVRYESGLQSALFTSGPSGGYTLDSWREVE